MRRAGTTTAERPALRGSLLALASAIAFGVTTPLVQRFGRGVGPFATAALLYMGAAVVGFASRSSGEVRLRRAHAGRVVAIAVLGAGLAPAALAWGLAHASGTSGSLMLNLEAAFTVALAHLLYREHVGRRVVVAAALLVVGGALLVIDHGVAGGGAGPTASGSAIASGSTTGVLGLVAVAGAALAWALDNTLARPLSALDPASVVAAKSAVGASLSTGVALVLGERWPAIVALGGLVIVGATGYGLSLRWYLKAQRELGAGRTASVFAAAPFCGALVAWALGEAAGGYALAAGGVMIVGVMLHMTERHAHVHEHEALEHEHAHRHDDGHHAHAHADGVRQEEEHAHSHRHERVVHRHAHVPDLHHGHGHGGGEGEKEKGDEHAHAHEDEHEHAHAHHPDSAKD